MRFMYLVLSLYSVLCTPTFVPALGSLVPFLVASALVSYRYWYSFWRVATIFAHKNFGYLSHPQLAWNYADMKFI